VITCLGSAFDTSTRTVTSSATCYFSVSSSSSRKAARIGTATSLHGIERDDYINKRYVD
jgi:hypothetical protein